MPIPILFIGIAVATGAVGIGKTTKAGFDQYNAKKLNENSDERMEEAANRLNIYRQQCEKSLEMLGEEKLFVQTETFLTSWIHLHRLKMLILRSHSGLTN